VLHGSLSLLPEAITQHNIGSIVAPRAFHAEHSLQLYDIHKLLQTIPSTFENILNESHRKSIRDRG
jgi:hypothetical protein